MEEKSNISKLISLNIYIKILIVLVLAVFFYFYFKAFYSTGIYFEDTFLKKKEGPAEIHYMGSNEYGDIKVTVEDLKKAGVKVTYQLPDNQIRQYTVHFNESNWKREIDSILDSNGELILIGDYHPHDPFLSDRNGNILTGNTLEAIFINTESPYNADYQVNLKHVADVAMGVETIRGKYDYLILAGILFLVTAIDWLFPLFFFKLRHVLYVSDPEPSGFYQFIQKIAWYISPIFIIGFLLAAIF